VQIQGRAHQSEQLKETVRTRRINNRLHIDNLDHPGWHRTEKQALDHNTSKSTRPVMSILGLCQAIYGTSSDGPAWHQIMEKN
jgi:hypothetical protein